MRSLFDARGPLGVPRASRADVYRRDESVSERRQSDAGRTKKGKTARRLQYGSWPVMVRPEGEKIAWTTRSKSHGVMESWSHGVTITSRVDRPSFRVLVY